jgi:hypothetical protein
MRLPSLKPMINRTIAFAFLALLLFSKPATAQIASYVDDSGKVIYTNGDSQLPRRGSNMRSPSTIQLSRLATESSGAGLANVADVRLERIVQDASERQRLDPALVKAVISTESGWNARAISQKGAIGLMQLIPATAQRFGVGNPFDPAQNVEGGTMYLKSLLERYNGDLTKSLAAYNAGEHAVDLSGGVPAFRETQLYVQKVTHAYFRPGSGRTSTLWSPPRPAVRQEVNANGRVVFTNE